MPIFFKIKFCVHNRINLRSICSTAQIPSPHLLDVHNNKLMLCSFICFILNSSIKLSNLHVNRLLGVQATLIALSWLLQGFAKHIDATGFPNCNHLPRSLSSLVTSHFSCNQFIKWASKVILLSSCNKCYDSHRHEWSKLISFSD